MGTEILNNYCKYYTKLGEKKLLKWGRNKGNAVCLPMT